MSTSGRLASTTKRSLLESAQKRRGGNGPVPPRMVEKLPSDNSAATYPHQNPFVLIVIHMSRKERNPPRCYPGAPKFRSIRMPTPVVSLKHPPTSIFQNSACTLHMSSMDLNHTAPESIDYTHMLGAALVLLACQLPQHLCKSCFDTNITRLS